MTVTQMEAVAQVLRLHPLRNPYSATQYESLSPIHFSNWEELSKKLLTYGIKYKKGRPHDRDDSQANRCFVLTGGCDGVLRGAFEYQRCAHLLT
jgi:hypothetical protein